MRKLVKKERGGIHWPSNRRTVRACNFGGRENSSDAGRGKEAGLEPEQLV